MLILDQPRFVLLDEVYQHRMHGVCSEFRAFQTPCRFVRNYLYKPGKRMIFIGWASLCSKMLDLQKFTIPLTCCTFQRAGSAALHKMKHVVFFYRAKLDLFLCLAHLHLLLKHLDDPLLYETISPACLLAVTLTFSFMNRWVWSIWLEFNLAPAHCKM